MYMKNIGRRIKYFRQRLGISQFELSQRSNISQASIARIEANQQKNLKTQTIEKLAAGLGVSFSQIIEEPTIVKEDSAAYSTPRILPVIESTQIDKLQDLKGLSTLIERADSFEPSLSFDQSAFYLKAADDFLSSPVINEGDLLLIEPAVQVKDGDVVLFLSREQRAIGKIYHHLSMSILQPLSHGVQPIVFYKKDIKRLGVRIAKLSEIRKKC